MQKIFSLVIALAFLFLLTSLSFAVVTPGGTVQVWYQAANDKTLSGNQSNSTFRFDYLALTLNADIDPTNGIFSDIRFYQVAKNTGNSTDIRLNNAYYYGKGLLSDNDELDIGYIKLPFYNSTYNALFVGSLSYNARPQNSVGISYSGKLNTFTYALAVANAANKANYNSPSATEGVDLTLRLGYTPIDPLQIGLGYSKDKANNNNTTDLSVLDAAYTIGAFRIYTEYVALTPEAKDDLSGAYFEGSYQVVKPILVYAGRAVNISDGGNNGQQLIQYINSKTGINISGGPGGNNFSLSDNWTLFGVKYQIGPQVTLQGEFLQQDSPKAKWIFGLRSSIKF